MSIDYVISRDDGNTWGERGKVYTAKGKDKVAGAPQVLNVGGTLVVSFMTNEDVNVGQIDGGQLKVVTSDNGGSTWSPATVLGDQGSHWPGLFTTDSSHFLALYSKDRLGAVSQLYEIV